VSSGYQTLVGDRGVQLSRGERKREGRLTCDILGAEGRGASDSRAPPNHIA
jgi:hypothetical protein